MSMSISTSTIHSLPFTPSGGIHSAQLQQLQQPTLLLLSSPSLSSPIITSTSGGDCVWNPLALLQIPRGGGGGGSERPDESSKPPKSSSSSSSSSPSTSKRKKKPKTKPSKTKAESSTASSTSTSTSAASETENDDGNNSKRNNNNNNNNNKSKNNNPIMEQILQHPDDYYRVLGVAPDASSAHITKAYRKRAVQTHPDKTGGDRRAFDIVAEAYDVLGGTAGGKDPQRRAMYDRFGKAGLEQGASMGGGGAGAGMRGATSFSDMFSQMFPHSHHQQQQQQQQHAAQRRNPTMRYQLQVSLEDLYRGVTKDVLVRPSPSSPFGNSRSRQSSSSSSKAVSVDIPKGTVSGQPIILSGAMDWMDDRQTPGDLIFLVVEEAHPVFTRRHHDLAMEVVVSLDEAICGLDDYSNRSIRHLDGRLLHIRSATTTTTPTTATRKKTTGGTKGDHKDDANANANDNANHDDEEEEEAIPIMIQTGDVQVLKGKGFPKSPRAGSDPHEYGDLYLQFRVELPSPSSSSSSGSGSRSSQSSSMNRLTADERDQLGHLLRKLQGTTSKHNAKGMKEKKERKKKTTGTTSSRDNHNHDDDHAVDEDDGEDVDTIFHLSTAKATDFGRASGTTRIEHPDHEDHEEDDTTNPFGSSSSGRGFYFGGNSANGFFGGGSAGANPFSQSDHDDPDSNVQCQQM